MMPLFKKKKTLQETFVSKENPLEPTVGIFVQWVKHEEAGEVIALYCPDCKRTDFFCSPWAVKDDTPFFQYWKISMECTQHYHRPQSVMIGTFKSSVMTDPRINPMYQGDRPLGRLE